MEMSDTRNAPLQDSAATKPDGRSTAQEEETRSQEDVALGSGRGDHDQKAPEQVEAAQVERRATGSENRSAPADDSPPPNPNSDAGDVPASNGSLVSDPESLRRRWDSVQVGFVDDPRQAVNEADLLVSSAIDELVTGFQQQRQRLEAAWSDGGEASTDDLRSAFRLYRSFFERLIQV
jgi:hypothetical protein